MQVSLLIRRVYLFSQKQDLVLEYQLKSQALSEINGGGGWTPGGVVKVNLSETHEWGES